MDTLPLLPRGEWTHQASTGLHSLTDQEYQQNLCENYYDASDFGTPSPLAQALVFRNRLDRFLLDIQDDDGESRFESSFERWSLLVKGIYLRRVSVAPVNLAELGDLGRIIRGELPKGAPFQFLVYEDEVVGFTVPDIGFVPAVRFPREREDDLRREVKERTVDAAREYFAGWVRTFDQKELGDLSFYSLLYELVRRWCPEATGELPREPKNLFGEGPRVWLGDGLDDLEVRAPRFPLYVGIPVQCPNEPCYYDGLTSARFPVSKPDDFHCPSCELKQDWLQEYTQWVHYSEEKGTYLIYAFEDSGIHDDPYRKNVTYEEDGIEVETSRMTVKVEGLVLTEEALKCTRLTFFRDGEGKVIQPSLPVRGEYYGLVKLSPVRRPFQDRSTGEYVVFLQVDGWDDEIVLRYDESEIQYEEALFLTWPNFTLPGWNVYFYLLEADPRLQKAGIRLRALDPKEPPRLLAASRGQLDRPIDAFEIVFAPEDQGGGVVSQAGVFTVPRYEVKRGESALTLSLDYGTSSTSAWYRLGAGEPRMVRFRDFTEEVIGNRHLSNAILDHSHWLPTYRLEDYKTAERFYRAQLESESEVPLEPEEIIRRLDYVIPSDLIIDQPVSAEKLDRPLSGFRICHPYAARPDGEVKYETKTLSVEGDKEGRYTYEQAVSRYLEMFMILTLATIVNQEERAGYLKVRASFPRAFDSEKLATHLQALDKVLHRVEDLTGFTTNGTFFIDEARAAAFSARVPEGLTLVMDMGGGTTDVGLFQWDEGELEPVFTESLLYGGNAFLRMLAGRQDADLFPKPTIRNDFNERMLWLFREIRLRGFDTVVSSQYRGNTASRDTMLDLLLRFYAPLALFVRRLFDALALERGGEVDFRKQPVTYYLVGNGWTLGDAIAPLDSGYQQGYGEVFRYLLEQQGFTDLTMAREPSFDARERRWPGPKAAVGYGSIIAPDRIFYNSIDAACGDGNGIRSIAGFDYYYTDGSNGRRPVDWNEEVPHRIESMKQLPVLSEIELPEEWDFIDFEKGAGVQALQEVCADDITRVERPVMTRSVLTRFLENVYVAQLSKGRRT